MKGAAIEGGYEAITTEFDSISAKIIGPISNYKLKFEDLNWKYQDILALILKILNQVPNKVPGTTCGKGPHGDYLTV